MVTASWLHAPHFVMGKIVLHHKKLYVSTVGVVLVFVTLAQLLYPSERALPYARLGGQSVRGLTRDKLAARIQVDFQQAHVKLAAGDSSETIPLGTIGANLNTDSMTKQLALYPSWQRFVPFSFVFVRPSIDTLDVYFDQSTLKAKAEELSSKLSKPYIDAQLAINEGELVVTTAKPGINVNAEELEQLLAASVFSLGTTDIRAPVQQTQPDRTDLDIASVRGLAEAAISRNIVITAPSGETFTPDSATLASWLQVGAEGKNIAVTVNEESVAAYVAGINERVKTDPGVTQISVVDGEETERKPGSEGEEIASDELIAGLARAVMSNEASQELTIRMRPVPTIVVQNRRYSSSQKGLQSYVAHTTSSQNIRISLVQLDGNRWTAEGRASESTPSASTYKLFVALSLFGRIDSGQLTWGIPMLDTNVDGCFERMIVPSTNPCAEKFIAEVGRDSLNNLVYSKGFSRGTSFTNPVATHTTAGDLTKYLIGLNDGTLISGNNRDLLLGKMGRQLYRYGIPTGSAGSVQDKVGFLWDYVHDTAIVRHPRGTYVVTIMTKGQSYARIAQITRELERIMYS